VRLILLTFWFAHNSSKSENVIIVVITLIEVNIFTLTGWLYRLLLAAQLFMNCSIKIILNIEHGELLVKRKAMKVRIISITICAHKSEKFWYNALLLPFNWNFFWENEFKILFHFTFTFIHTEKNFRLYWNLSSDLLEVNISKSWLAQPSNQKVFYYVVCVRLNSRRILHFIIKYKFFFK